LARRSLHFRAGPAAYRILREEGFDFQRFQVMAGASGGPKWLVLSQLDRVIAEQLLPTRRSPLDLLGSSIGAWRFTCYGMLDPFAAIARFEDAYLAQTYQKRPTPSEVSRETRRIFRCICGESGEGQILANENVRLNVMAVRARGIAGLEARWLQGAAIAAASLGNLISRRALGLAYERALFQDPRSEQRFEGITGLPMHRIPLSPENLEDAVVASGSIPLVLSGVRDIQGAPRGTYRDGGVTDYHFDSPMVGGQGLVFYPHFYGHMVPGWFDKHTGRRAGGASTDRVLLMFPSTEFVQSLPYGKIPDRDDFNKLDDVQRQRYWRRVISECQRLADELRELLDSGELGSVLQSMP